MGDKDEKTVSEVLAKLLTYIGGKRKGYKRLQELYPWEEFYGGAIEALDDIEEEIRGL